MKIKMKGEILCYLLHGVKHPVNKILSKMLLLTAKSCATRLLR